QLSYSLFFFNTQALPATYPLSLHDALPIFDQFRLRCAPRFESAAGRPKRICFGRPGLGSGKPPITTDPGFWHHRFVAPGERNWFSRCFARTVALAPKRLVLLQNLSRNSHTPKNAQKLGRVASL